jgi:hypothetical protein
MAPTPREREWRRILDRWRRSGTTCRAFCRREALDENSFYHWKREVRLRDERRRAARAARPTPRRLRLRKPKVSLHWPAELLRETAPDPSTEAVAGPEPSPRSLVPPAPTGVVTGFHPVRVTNSGFEPFEIAFPNGRLLRVGADFDALSLARLLPILEAATVADSGRGGSPC